MRNITILFLALIIVCGFEIQAQSIEKLEFDGAISVEELSPFTEVQDGVYVVPVTQEVTSSTDTGSMKTMEEEESCFVLDDCQVHDIDTPEGAGVFPGFPLKTGQSFVACLTGVVTGVSLKIFAHGDEDRTIDFYIGENPTTGTIVGNPYLVDVLLPKNKGYTPFSFDLSTKPFPVTEGMSYRFEFEVENEPGIVASTDNSYEDGMMTINGFPGFGTSYDYVFELIIEETEPVPLFSGETIYCEGETPPTIEVDDWTTYSWSNGAITQGVEAAAGVYFVTVGNEDGCTSTGSIEVIENPVPIVEIETPESICPEDDITLMEVGEGGVEWQWSGPNEFNSDKQHPLLEEASAEYSGTYYVTVTNQYGCKTTAMTELEVPEVFSFDLENPTQTQTSTGMNVYGVELCGGTMSYSVDIEAEGGFASSNLYPSTNVGCQLLQITYVNGVSWTVTITDSNDCSDEESIISSDDLDGTPLLMIDGFTATSESHTGDNDGALTVNVSGGAGACGSYSYEWEGPNLDLTNTGGTTGNSISGLGAGVYTLTVTDCEGNTAVGNHNLTVATGRGRGRGRKAAINEQLIQSLQAVPNPFSHTTTIRLKMNESEYIRLAVYGLDGSLQEELFSGVVEAEQQNEFTLSGENWSTGIYILQLQTESGEMHHEKLLMTK